jgi:hypothetical protein
MESGGLYVVFNKWIRNPETNEIPYKIGITNGSVYDRYYGLGLKMPGKFETLFAYQLEDYTKAEQYIQGILYKHRENGEWFNIGQNELDLIKRNCEAMGGILITDEVEIEIETEGETIGGVVPIADILKTFNDDKDGKEFEMRINPEKNCMISRRGGKYNAIFIFITSNTKGVRFSWQTPNEDYGELRKSFPAVEKLYKNEEGKATKEVECVPGHKQHKFTRIWIEVNQEDPLNDCLAIAKVTKTLVGYY